MSNEQDSMMIKRITKFALTFIASMVIPITGVVYVGATNLTGKLAVMGTGLFVYCSLAIWYSILHDRPTSFHDWLQH